VKANSLLEPVALSVFPHSLCPEEILTAVPRNPDNLKLAILEKTAITWKELLGTLGVILLVIGVFTSLFYKTLLTSQIETGISTSPYLKTNFESIGKQFEIVNSRLDKIVSASPILNPKILSAVLKEATKGDAKSLASALPNVRNILSIAREKRVPLPDQDYKEISNPLFAKYDSAKTPLQHELWLTFIELANTRSSTDTVLHPVTDSEIAQATATGNFFEGKSIDLSSQTNWKDTIFRNCRFTISQPENDLTLTHVRFVDSEFSPMAENKTSLNLFKSFIESDGPTVTANVARFVVDQPIGKTNPPS
jgi:hypothetical protein